MGLIPIMLALMMAGCTTSEEPYSLYKTPLMGQQTRLHVFTFDASGGREYNKNNCQLALERFEKEQGGKFKFWCELGGYGR